MSYTYWGIDGLGICLDDILEMLDAEEIRLAMQTQIDDVFSDTEPEFAEYLQAGNDDRFEYLDDDLCRVTDQICGVIAAADEDNLLTSANDGDGRYFLLYPLIYPWERREGECESEEEARRHIRDLLLRFTLPGITSGQVMEKIDFINEVGSAN